VLSVKQLQIRYHRRRILKPLLSAIAAEIHTLTAGISHTEELDVVKPHSFVPFFGPQKIRPEIQLCWL